MKKTSTTELAHSSIRASRKRKGPILRYRKALYRCKRATCIAKWSNGDEGAPFPSYGWLYAKFWLEMVGRYTLTPSLGVIPFEYRHKWYTATNYILWATFHLQNVSVYLQPYFYVIRPQSYRILRNNSNYTAITPFKVIQGHWFWYQSKAHMRLPISD